MAELAERARDRIDRRRGIELGNLVLGQPERQVVILQVVSEPDPHVGLLRRERA
jgi:hypothetical protein